MKTCVQAVALLPNGSVVLQREAHVPAEDVSAKLTLLGSDRTRQAFRLAAEPEAVGSRSDNLKRRSIMQHGTRVITTADELMQDLVLAIGQRREGMRESGGDRAVVQQPLAIVLDKRGDAIERRRRV